MIVYLSNVIVFSSSFFFKRKTAYELRISDWSSDVCSSDLGRLPAVMRLADRGARRFGKQRGIDRVLGHQIGDELVAVDRIEAIGLLKAHAEEFQIGRASCRARVCQ